MFKKTVVINLVGIVNTDVDNATPYFGFKDMAKEYTLDKRDSNVEVFFIYFYITNKIIRLRLDELKYGILGWYLKTHIDRNEHDKKLDIGSPRVLKELFNLVVTKERKDYNKILVTYSHGTGFSVLKGEVTNNDIVGNSKLINFPMLQKEHYIDTFIGLKSIIKKNIGDIDKKIVSNFYNIFTKNLKANLNKQLTTLTMDELAQAISKSNVKKFDLILFGNCFMQTTDTFYALKDCSKYIIGTETIFSWQGFDYSLLNKINAEIEKDFLTAFVYFSFLKINDFKRGYPENPVSKNEMLLSILNCDKANDFFTSFSSLISNLNGNFNAYKNILFSVAKKMKDVSSDLNYGLKDVYNFLELLQNNINIKNIGSNEIIKLINDLLKFLKEININNVFGTDLNNSEITPKGLSINLPVNKKETEGYYDVFTVENDSNIKNKYQSSFAQKTGWGLLVEKLLKDNKLGY